MCRCCSYPYFSPVCFVNLARVPVFANGVISKARPRFLLDRRVNAPSSQQEEPPPRKAEPTTRTRNPHRSRGEAGSYGQERASPQPEDPAQAHRGPWHRRLTQTRGRYAASFFSLQFLGVPFRTFDVFIGNPRGLVFSRPDQNAGFHLLLDDRIHVGRLAYLKLIGQPVEIQAGSAAQDFDSCIGESRQVVK